jgi:hypothetical protein
VPSLGDAVLGFGEFPLQVEKALVGPQLGIVLGQHHDLADRPRQIGLQKLSRS